VKIKTTEVDAIVIGSGPNGLAAAITLQRNGLQVLLIEGKDQIGGGLRTEEITLPGFKHDICSAIHPMAAVSPFFANLPLEDYGLKYLYPEVDLAHPFDDGNCAALLRSVSDTSLQFGGDSQAYIKLLNGLLKNWPDLIGNILSPLKFPSKSTYEYLKFGLNAIQPATWIAKKFNNQYLKGFWAGMAAHSIQPLDKMTTSAIALVLLANGHAKGWPIPVGGGTVYRELTYKLFLIPWRQN
jgi:phytoene dehydrogenase-like protein